MLVMFSFTVNSFKLLFKLNEKRRLSSSAVEQGGFGSWWTSFQEFGALKENADFPKSERTPGTLSVMCDDFQSSNSASLIAMVIIAPLCE